MKVTPYIYQQQIAIHYTSSHPPPLPKTSYELQYNAQASTPLPLLSVKNCNTVHKNPEAQCLSQIWLGYILQ